MYKFKFIRALCFIGIIVGLAFCFFLINSVGDPIYRKTNHIIEMNIQSTIDENFSPQKEENILTVDIEEPKKYAPAIKKSEEISTSPENIEIEEVANDTSAEIKNEATIEETAIIPEKFIPQGEYSVPDFSIYTEDEQTVLNLILDKINENKDSDLKEEIIEINTLLDIKSYYKIASYFYLYYGQKRAVDETFDIINHTSHDITTGEEIRKYMIRMRYDDIREFEKELQVIKEKADEILNSFDSGNEIFILNQISNYLKDTIVYTPNNYSLHNALLDEKSVCNGYALAFNILANRAGIKSDMCIGKVEEGFHAWNRVVLSTGEILYYDITFYDSQNPNPQYIESQTPLHTSDYLINDYTDCFFN